MQPSTPPPVCCVLYIYICSVNMFIWIDNGKYITAIKRKFIHFFFIWIFTDDFRLILKNFIDPEKDFEILRIFINILGDFLDLISST